MRNAASYLVIQARWNSVGTLYWGYLHGLLKFDADHGNKEIIDDLMIDAIWYTNVEFEWSAIVTLVTSENVDAISDGCR